MAKRPLKKPDLPPGDRRAFVEYMHALLVDHGDPSVATLATVVDGHSAAGIYRALTSTAMPPRDLVAQLARALGGEEAADRALAAWAAGVKEERELTNRDPSGRAAEIDTVFAATMFTGKPVLSGAAFGAHHAAGGASDDGNRSTALPADRVADLLPAGLPDPGLSAREREILLTWFRVDSKTEVAQRLYLSLGTVNTHIARIRAKYAAVGRTADTKAALVVRALQDGFLGFDDL